MVPGKKIFRLLVPMVILLAMGQISCDLPFVGEQSSGGNAVVEEPASPVDPPAAEVDTGESGGSGLRLADSLQRNVSGTGVSKPADALLDYRYAIQCRVFDTVVFDRSTVYADCGDQNAILALDEESGAELWRFTPADDELVIMPNPVGNTLYASSEHNIFAINPQTGAERWRFSYYDSEESGYMAKVVSADDQAAYILDSHGILHALDSTTGAERWQRQICEYSYWDSSPVVAGDYLFLATMCIEGLAGQSEEDFNEEDLSSRNSIVALDKNTGEELWTYQPEAQAIMSLIVRDGTLFAIDGSSLMADSFSNAPAQRSASSVTAIDARTGEERWVYNKSDESLGVGFAAADGMVFVGSEYDRDGENGYPREHSRFYAIDAATGEEAWQFDPEGKIETDIFVAGGVVLFGSVYNLPSNSEGEMKVQSHTYARDAKTGEHRFMLFNEEGQGNDYGLPPLKFINDATMYFVSIGDERAGVFRIVSP